MTTRFIPRAASEPEPLVLEAQQQLLLNVLRRAGAEPVSYADLRAAGVELPASVVSELELAGVRIERCYGGAHGERRVLGVRLVERQPPIPEPAPDPTPEHVPAAVTESGSSGGWNPVHVYRASPARAGASAASEWLGAAGGAAAHRLHGMRTPSARILAPAALAIAVIIVAVLVLTGLSGGTAREPRHHPTARSPVRPQLTAKAPTTAHSATSASSSAPTGTATATATTPATPTPVSPALATHLEAQGHSLLESGQYASAIEVLRRALAATGEHRSACLEPSSSTCLTYAYALYDLGRALRLNGNSAAAVPILEARLQIDNQRSVVAAELKLARRQTG